MDITLLCPTYKKFDYCVDMINSAMSGELPPTRTIILDNGAGKFTEYLKEHEIELYDNVSILTAPYNLGCEPAWNVLLDIVRNTYPNDLAIVVNDDLILDPSAIKLLHDAALTDYVQNDAYGLVYCAGGIDAPNAFSLFMVHPQTLYETIGRFSDTLRPAYYGDNDYAYRMKLAGYDLTRVPGVTAQHQNGGSATLKSYTKEEEEIHHHQFRRNTELYMRMWGGMPGEEKYKQPFDNQDIMRHMLELHQRYGF